ncbi:MAG TPA: methionyl-tRNA formyltransferase, partial [Blastocatellia bacterium]|nr:methionyl-tRNA formyltransferase [Blastocatellia bacterium]
RGAAPINWAIAKGESETGITIMQMDAGMDTGPILAQRAIPIGNGETAPELSARLARLGAELLSETLSRIERDEIKPAPQDDSEATYAPMLKREDGLIDWRMTAGEIANRVRAFQPWPGTYTDFRGGRLIFWRAHEVSEPVPPDAVEAGKILRIDESGMTISCARPTVLRIEELQVEGKRRMSARDFANGARLRPGDSLRNTT